jgi:hypothetical protein
MNIFERLFLVALWPYAKAVEFVGNAIDSIDWGSDD